MSAVVERIKSTVASARYFLGETTAEGFEDMTYELADAPTRLHTEVFQSAHDANGVCNTIPLRFYACNSFQPRKETVFKRTLSALLGQISELMDDLADARNRLPMPFGWKDDGLLPREVYCDADCQGRNFFSFLVISDVSGRGLSGLRFILERAGGRKLVPKSFE